MNNDLIREILLGYLMERGTDEHESSTFRDTEWYGRYDGRLGKKGGLLTALAAEDFIAKRVDERRNLWYWRVTEAGLDFLKGNNDETN